LQWPGTKDIFVPNETGPELVSDLLPAEISEICAGESVLGKDPDTGQKKIGSARWLGP
jgi:hypothetical protein